MSARSRHGEGRHKEPGVFSLAKHRLSSDTVCAKYTGGEGCWRQKELVKPRGQHLHKSNWECTGQEINAVCGGKGGFPDQRRREVPEQPPKISCRDVRCCPLCFVNGL